MTIDLDTNNQKSNRICVIGVGGAGGNAVNNMIKREINGVDFITANTDKKALDKTLANEKILLGEELTKGGGAGAKPEVGKQAAEESAEQIKSAIEGYELAFVTCGMGGGTGTGGSPVIARLIKEANPKTVVVGIVCKCFNREGTNKTILAEEGIANLKASVDAIIVVPNDKILEVCSGCSPLEAYSKANDILYNAVRGIVDIIEIDSFMNVDMNDVRTTLAGVGDVIIGIGIGKGENAAKEAVLNAINSPFFDNLAVHNTSEFILMNIKAGNYPINQIDEAYKVLRDAAGENANLITGEDFDENSDEFIVTIIAPATKSSDFIPDNSSKKNNKNSDNNNSVTIENDTLIVINEQETKSPKSKKVVTPECQTINLFNANADNESNMTPADLMGSKSKIKNVASANRKEQAESLEVIAGQTPLTPNVFGRPHGDVALKSFDTPAFYRRTSKYDSIENIAVEVETTDVLPDRNDMMHIRNLVNSATTENSNINRFVRRIANQGLNSR